MPPVRDVAVLESAPPPGPTPEAVLSVAYADTRADELSYALDLPPQPALRTHAVALGALGVDLRILGYSHQVVVTGRDGRVVLSETVARLPESAGAAPMPEAHDETRAIAGPGRLRYSFTTSVTPLSAVVGIEALMLELDGAERGILGVFPGHPHAFTGLLTAPAESGAQWRSWHAYPATDELVSTRSRLVGVPS